MDELVFTRKQTPLGTEFDAESGRVVVRKKNWARPGFKSITSTGWVIEADGEQVNAAYPTAKQAMSRANYPGTLARLRGILEANNDRDDEAEETLRDYVVKAVMDWLDEGADHNAVALVRDAAVRLRTWENQRAGLGS